MVVVTRHARDALLRACRGSSWTLFCSALVRVEDVDSCDAQGVTALMHAAAQADVRFVDALLRCGADPWHRNAATGNHALGLACHRGASDIVRRILSERLPAEGRGTHPLVTEALLLALKSGSVPCACEILRAGLVRHDVIDDAFLRYGHTMLTCAATNGWSDAVNALLAARAHVDRPNLQGSRALDCAARRAHAECVALLVAAGARVDATDPSGNTPLLLACLADARACVYLLLMARADPDVVAADEWTAVHAAVHEQNWECVRLLCHVGGADLGIRRHGRTPILWAAAAGEVRTMGELLEHSPHRVDDREGSASGREVARGNTALMYASEFGHLDCVRELLIRGASARLRNDSGWTALTWAVFDDHHDVARALIESDPDLVRVTSTGNGAPLLHAACNGHAGCVRLLASHGADVNVTTELGGYTPLAMACFGGHVECVRALLRVGASDAGLRDGSRPWTPLMFAARLKEAHCVRELLAHSVSDAMVDAPGHRGTTALMHACDAGNRDGARLILQLGRADPNACDETGVTALMIASEEGCDDTVRTLLECGADAARADSLGQTARDYAVAAGRDATALDGATAIRRRYLWTVLRGAVRLRSVVVWWLYLMEHRYADPQGPARLRDAAAYEQMWEL